MRYVLLLVVTALVWPVAAYAQTKGSIEAYDAVRRATNGKQAAPKSPMRCVVLTVKDYVKKHPPSPRGCPRDGVVLVDLPRSSPLCKQTIKWKGKSVKLMEDRGRYATFWPNDIITEVRRPKQRPVKFKDVLGFRTWEHEACDGDKITVYRYIRGYGDPVLIKGESTYRLPTKEPKQ